MRNKEEILADQGWSDWSTNNKSFHQIAMDSMDEYAQQLSVEVIKEMQSELDKTSVLDNSHDTLEKYIILIKQTFDLK